MLQKPGWGLIAEPRLVHGWEQLYPDPGRFDPERFLGNSSEDRRYTFIPFGGGVHACLGAQLAMAIARVFAIHVLRAYRWQGQGSPRFDQFPLRMVKPDYRIRLQSDVHARHQERIAERFIAIGTGVQGSCSPPG